MKKEKFVQRVGFFLFFFLILQSTLYAHSYDLTSPNSWYFLGTVYTSPNGFLLGDNDGYTQGDSCMYQWYNYNYDYDVAISKVAFKAPFTFEFETAVDPTNYGFNYIQINCLSEDLVDETPLLQCTNIPPISRSSLDAEIYYGKRWEEGNKICAGIGIHSRQGYQCVEENERFNNVKITMDENHHATIYVNGEELYSGDFGYCEAHNGYMVIYMQSFDSQIDYLNGSIESNDIKPVRDILNGNEESATSDEYQQGYNAGYEAGIEYCQNHPEECGLTCGQEISSTENCATFNLFENKLHIPCFQIGDKTYWLDLKLIENNPVKLELTHFGENE